MITINYNSFVDNKRSGIVPVLLLCSSNRQECNVGIENLLFCHLRSLNLLQCLITPIFQNLPPKFLKMSTLIIQKLDVLNILLSLNDCFVWLLQCDA